MKNLLLSIAIVAGLAGPCFAQNPPVMPPAATGTSLPAERFDADKFLAPFIDNDTIALCHIDVSKVDIAAIDRLMNPVLDDLKGPDGDALRKANADGRAAFVATLARFKQAGGRHIFAMLDHDDIEELLAGQMPLAVVMPVEPGGNAKDLAAFLPEQGGDKGTVLRDDLVFYGDARRLKRLQVRMMAKRSVTPIVALGTIGPDAPPLHAVATLTADERRALLELMPRLPAEFGGTSIEPLTRDLATIRLSGRLSPAFNLTLSFAVLKGTGLGNGARDLQPVAEKMRDFLLAADWIKDQAGDGDTGKAMRALLQEALTPGVAGEGGAASDDLVFQITEAQVSRILRIELPEQMRANARNKREAAHAAAAQDIYVIMEACDTYARQHNGTFPESLDVLVKEKLLKSEQLNNPDDPARKPFVFHTWDAAVLKGADTLPVVWEQQDDAHPGGYVGMMKLPLAMAAQWTENRAEAEALVKQAEGRAKKSEPRQ